MNVSINKDYCSGCGICVDICPKVFYMGADGLASVKNPVSTDAGCVQEAAESCPNGAITIKR